MALDILQAGLDTCEETSVQASAPTLALGRAPADVLAMPTIDHQRGRPSRVLRSALAAAATALALTAFASSAAEAGVVSAKQADSFVESVGVNIHLTYSDTVYDEFSRVQGALRGLGVRYVRDGVGVGRPDVYRNYRALGEEGVKLDIVVGDPLQRWGIGSVDQQLNMIASEFPNAVATLEGPNEYDQSGDSNWIANLRNYQRSLWAGAHARPALASKPILGPSLVRESSRSELGDISAWTDQGNMHPYPGGQTPDSDSHAESELRLAAYNTGSQPVQATETGYQNAVANTTAGHRPTNEKVAGIYTPRLYLDNFRRGMARTFDYELIDVENDASRTAEYANFGLMRNDFSPKPAYTSLQRLIAVLADPGPSFRPGSLSYSIQGAPSTARQILLQRRDGSFDLVLWNAVSVWNTNSLTEINPASPPITVNFGQSIAATETFRPNDSAAAVASSSNQNSLSLALSPSVTVIHVVPTGATPPEPGPPQPLEPNPIPAGPGGDVTQPSAPGLSPSVPVGAASPNRGGFGETLSPPLHKLSPQRLHSLLSSIRGGCHSNCPLRADEAQRARALLLADSDADAQAQTQAATVSGANSGRLVSWLQNRAAQILRQAAGSGWGLDKRAVRYQAIVAVLRLSGAPTRQPTAQ